MTAPRALVVGTGFGCRIHVPALRAAGFEVAGLVGTNVERTERRAQANNIPKAYFDLDQAIEETGAVAVTIATPPATHAAITLTALKHKCHVICEKPMSSNTAEAQAMLDAAEKAGVTHFIGNEFRWSPDRAIVARAIQEGMIGEPRFMTLANYMQFVADPAAKMPAWWFDANAGGGWLGAQGSHIVDQVRTWLGDIESLSAALKVTSAREHSADDSYVLRFRLKNGCEGVVQQCAAAWGPSATMARVAGTHGSIWIDNGAVKLATKDGVQELTVPDDLILPPPPETSDDPRKAFSHLELGPFTRLCEALRAGVDGRQIKSAVPLPTFRDGLACMKVLDAIRESAANGGALIKL